MLRRIASLSAALAVLVGTSSVAAEVISIPADLRVGAVPDARGSGVPVRWVHGYFAGFPFHIDDARDLLDGVAFLPSFETWCGSLPYIDLSNRSNTDSLGRGAPTLLCAPFLDATQSSPITCRNVPGVPSGRYWTNGGAAMRARGAIAIRAAGVYTFAWGHDDGVSFRIGSVPVYEFPDGTGARVDVATVRFTEPGLYPFVLEWFDGIGGAIIDWYVSPGERTAAQFSNFTFALVPTEDLFPLDARDCTARCESCAFPTPVCDRAAGRCVRCLRSEDCGPCAVCREGACAAVRDVPGADGGSRCAPTPVDAGDDLRDVTSDASRDVADASFVLPTTSGGCGCAVGVARPRGVALAFVAALVVRCLRRRRPRRHGHR